MPPHPGSPSRTGLGSPGLARLLPPLPVFALQPLLGHIVASVAGRHPELFARMGEACHKHFLIDPTDLPVVLLLKPDPHRPELRAHNRGNTVGHDVRISGSFVTLLRMIDAKTDSDALFFNRELSVTGDVEAIVALRNALDDMDSTLADDVAATFGPFSRPVRAIFDFAERRP
ncbi:MAG: sterol-binding protein [Alphaproteobacteria bacterium]|nr:sterol-binding protein [Alphaproteobacteria bacterium]